jgi:tetratricopeptide (TPR) repeat protein
VSLVNDMLRDLEAGKREPLPDGVFTADSRAEQNRLQRKYLAVAIAAVLIPGAFYAGLNWREISAPEPTMAMSRIAEPVAQISALVAEPSPAFEEQVQAAAPAVQAQSGPVGEPAPAVQQAGNAEAALLARIEPLLQSAERALAENRLMTPVEDNAFSRYQAVLLLDPDQPQALEGIRNIAQRYLRFYTETFNNGAVDSAGQYREKAERVVSAYPQLASWFDARVAETEANLLRVAELDTGSDLPEAVEAAPVAAALPSQESPDTQTVRVVKTDRDQRVAAQASTLIAQGRFAQAESLLLAHLQQYPDGTAARSALVELYLQTANAAAASVHVEQLTDLADYQRAHFDARITMLHGDLERALNTLNAVSPAVAEAPDFHAYRAALFHRAQRYQDAAGVYEQLLALRQNESTYWLGLAVSLDALKDKAGALRAFRQAHFHSPADAPSRAYVEERIRNLSS